MNSRALLVATTRICAAAAGLSSTAAVILAVRYHPTPRSVAIALLAVTFLSVPLVGAGIARSEPRNPVGWIVLASGCFLPLAAAAYLYAWAVFQEQADLPAASWAGWLDGWPWVPAVAVIPVVGLVLFPNGRLPSRRWRPVLVIGVAVLAAISVGLLFGATLLDFPVQANPTALPGTAGSIAGGLITCVALIAPLSTASALSVHVRRRTALVQREALALRLVEPAAWLIAASWWLTLAITLVTADSLNALPAQALAVIVLAVTAWVAIRRYRLFDTRLAISRVLIYGLLSVCVIAVYLAVAAGVEAVASDVASAPFAVLAAVLVALPLRDLLALGVNRMVYGYRDDPYGALVRLGQRLEDAAVPDDVLPAVARTVRDVLRIAYVDIEIRGSRTTVGKPNGAQCETLSLIFAGETIGVLTAEQREPGVPFTPAERALLKGVSQQVAAAGHAVSLTQDLLRSRERLVAATEEERRRLRRDLHDGLGPGLAGVVLGLQRARRYVDVDPVNARKQLDELTVQTQQAVAEVRRLVYDLRPPALDELGLVGALSEQAQALGPIAVLGPDLPMQLPAAVEVAAYRIALEAMTNTARHAAATEATVRVSLDGALHLEISDNGTGLPVAYRAGVGIRSMRERAAGLGGHVSIEPGATVGTMVRATIPLESS